MATAAVLGSRKSKSPRKSKIAAQQTPVSAKSKSASSRSQRTAGSAVAMASTASIASAATASDTAKSVRRLRSAASTSGGSTQSVGDRRAALAAKKASAKTVMTSKANSKPSAGKSVEPALASTKGSVSKQSAAEKSHPLVSKPAHSVASEPMTAVSALSAINSVATVAPVVSQTVNPSGHRMVAQSTVSEDPRRDTLDLATQARARVWMQREVAFIDHPSFRQRDIESVEEVLTFSATVEDLPLQAELPDKLPPYLRRLCEVPLLTAEDERCLFRRMNFLKFQANVLRTRLREGAVRPADLDEIERLVQGAEKIRNRIIRANMRLVMSIVKHYISDAMAFDDLLSEGAAALLRAAEKFDCSRGFRFSTYVTKVVRREVFRLVMAHKRQSDRYATGSWDFIGEQSEERGDEVDNEVDLSALRGDLTEFFANLDPREQAILRARFGMDHDDKAPSLNDLGRRMGVSKERVRQLEMRAIRKLQKQFQQRRAERREAAAV